MAQYVIDIDDTHVKEQIQAILSNILTKELKNRYSESGHVMSQAIKDLVYSHKDEIIEKVVDRASKEIVRKGLPKLIDKLGE